MNIRPATKDDLTFLRKMLYEAARWNPDWPREPIEEVLAEPMLLRYYQGWGRPGDGGVKTIRLGDSPHGHEPAVTPTGHTETVRINRIFLYRGIDSGEIVAQVAAAKIFHVRAGEIFALSVTSAGIGKQNVIAASGQRGDNRARHSEGGRPL